MKLISPVCAASEVEALIASGADEFFCGLVPESWSRGQPHDWLNRRNPGTSSLRSLEDLERVVGAAARSDVPVFVALNGRYFRPEHIAGLVDLAGGIAAAGARGVIVADLSLVLAIRKAKIPLEIHLSSVATCQNSQAAAFFADLGVNRVILPRNLSTREIGIMVGKGVKVEYEAFFLNDGCTYEEGLCLTTHQLGPFCGTRWDAKMRPGPGAPSEEEWSENWRCYERFQWHLDNCGGNAVSAKGLPNGPCGLCALPALQAAGVASLKIGGRESEPSRRIASLKLARRILDWSEQGLSGEAIAERARELRGTPELCDGTYMCFYRG